MLRCLWVTVHLSFQFGEIYSHLGVRPVGHYFDEVNWGGRLTLWAALFPGMGFGIRFKKKELNTRTCGSHFLTGYNVAVCLKLQTLVTSVLLMGCDLELWAKTRPSFLKLLLPEYFSTASGKMSENPGFHKLGAIRYPDIAKSPLGDNIPHG